MKSRFFYLKTILVACMLLAIDLNAQMQKIYILKEIDDDNIIIVTEKNEKYLLEKWSMRFSPLVFEGKTFLAEVTPMWVTIYFENRDPIKWSVEKYLGDYNDSSPNVKKQKSNSNVQGYTGLNEKHWIKKVFDRGKLIQLEDNSLWEISPIDIIYSVIWLPVSNVYVTESDNPYYPFKIINTDDGGTVEAKFISK